MVSRRENGQMSDRLPVLIVDDQAPFRAAMRAVLKRTTEFELVGEAAACQCVDPATGVAKVKTGQAVKIPLKINEDFRGTMEVRAVDAETGVTYGSPLTLTTAYLE